MTTNPHPVESATRTCCAGIGNHTPQCAVEQLHRLSARRARLLAELRRIDAAETAVLGGGQ